MFLEIHLSFNLHHLWIFYSRFQTVFLNCGKTLTWKRAISESRSWKQCYYVLYEEQTSSDIKPVCSLKKSQESFDIYSFVLTRKPPFYCICSHSKYAANCVTVWFYSYFLNEVSVDFNQEERTRRQRGSRWTPWWVCIVSAWKDPSAGFWRSAPQPGR